MAREQQIFAGVTDSLAALLTGEAEPAAADIEAWVAANAIMGVHRALVAHARRRIIDGARHPAVGEGLRERAEQALSLLELGLRSFAVKEQHAVR